MKSLLQQWYQHHLIKLVGINSVHIAVKIVINALMSKLIAIYAGTLGMALMGNLRNLLQGLQTFSVLGVEQGLVKFTAQYQKDKDQLKRYFSTAWVMSVISTIILSAILLILSRWLAQYMFNGQYVNLIRVVAICLPFYVIFAFISSLLQGMEFYRSYVFMQIAITIAIFVISAGLIFQYKVTGALYSIVIAIIVQCVIAIIFLKRSFSQFTWNSYVTLSFDKEISRQLLSFSIMALASALLLPVAHILVRTYLLNTIGEDETGWWEGVLRISRFYMLFSSTLISLYILPTLSKNDSVENFRNTVWEFVKTIIPLVVMGMILVYLLRHFIIESLFTEEFNGMLPLFKWQLLGDFIKVITTVMAFQFIARNDIKRYLIAEVISVTSFMIFSYWLINKNGVDGVVQAHLLNYILYFFVLLILLRKEIFIKI